MSTRGFITFVADGEEKTTYNHSDSYPAGLGADVLSWLRELRLTDEACCGIFTQQYGCADHGRATTMSLRDKAAALRMVDEDNEPTPEDIERLQPFANTSVGARRETPDWYQLLRETQGDPAMILRAGVALDAANFPRDSLFAEWGYVVDTDAATFEVYQGFQHNGHDKGRFADRDPAKAGYFPVALVASFPFGDLPTEKQFMATVEPEDETE